MNMTTSEEEDFNDSASSTILLDFEGNVLFVPSVPVESSFNSDGIQVNRVKPCTALPVCESTFTIAYLPIVGNNLYENRTPCTSEDSNQPSWTYHSTPPSKMSEFLSARRLKRWPVTLLDSDLSGDEDPYRTSGSRESSAFGSVCQWSRAAASLPVLQPDERLAHVRPRSSVSLHDSIYMFRGASRLSHMAALKEDVSLLDQPPHLNDKEFQQTMKQ